jgi:outer membrane protein assembly factor BamB
VPVREREPAAGRARAALAALSGILLGLSFPKLGHGAVAFAATAPLLVAVSGARPRAALAAGWLAGLVWGLATLYWTAVVLAITAGCDAAPASPRGRNEPHAPQPSGPAAREARPGPERGEDGPEDAARFWPQWRGPLGTGAAPHADPPVRWSESENVRWKAALPGKGHSTPAVWGGRVFVTTAVPHGPAVDPDRDEPPGAHDNAPVTRARRFVVLALDRDDGRLLWRRTVREALPLRAHYTASFASPSPVTDGEHLFAHFGSHGLYAFGLDGELKWEVGLGEMRPKHGHGEGSSPVLHGDTLVVNWDHERRSFLVALDKRTGAVRWRAERDEVTSWATPIVVEHAGRPQVIVSGTRRLRAYDLGTGEVVWECGGLSANIVASPVAADGMVFAGSSYEKQALLAIRLDGAAGDVTGTGRVAWTRHRGTPYVPSPLLYGGALYFLRHYQGILTRVDARTGADAPGALRLGGIGNVYASPVAAAGRVYVTDLDGDTMVLSADARPEVLALNRLDDRFSASAAVAGRELYLRGEHHLYSLAEP